MKNTLVRVACLIIMVISFIAFIAKAPAFPIASENLLPWSVWFTISVIVNMMLWYPVMKLVAFSLGVIWFYAFIAALVPDTSTATGPVTELDWSDPDAVVEIGALYFQYKRTVRSMSYIGYLCPKR